MSARIPGLGDRIEDVERRIAERVQRVEYRWHQTQRAAKGLVKRNRALPLAAAASAAVLIGFLVLRKSRRAVNRGGALGIAAAIVMALLQPRSRTLLSFAWDFLARHRPVPPRGTASSRSIDPPS